MITDADLYLLVGMVSLITVGIIMAIKDEFPDVLKTIAKLVILSIGLVALSYAVGFATVNLYRIAAALFGG